MALFEEDRDRAANLAVDPGLVALVPIKRGRQPQKAAPVGLRPGSAGPFQARRHSGMSWA